MNSDESDDDFWLCDMTDGEEEDDQERRTEEDDREDKQRVSSIPQEKISTSTVNGTKLSDDLNITTKEKMNAVSSTDDYRLVARDERGEYQDQKDYIWRKPRIPAEEISFDPTGDSSVPRTAQSDLQLTLQSPSHHIGMGQPFNRTSNETNQSQVMQLPLPNDNNYTGNVHSPLVASFQETEVVNPAQINLQNHGFAKEHNTSNYQAASLSVFNVTGNTGVKVIHQQVAGNADSFLKNIIDQSKLRLDRDLNTDLLVKTEKVKQCEKKLKTWGMVTITGGAGEGKTMASLYLLQMMSETDTRQPLILTDPNQWDFIPSSQQKKTKFTVLIDDAFGKTNLVEDLRIRWEQKLPLICPLIETGCVCLIVAMRSNIYNLCGENLKNCELFKRCPVEYSTTDITEIERLNLLENHLRLFGKNVTMNKSEKTKIIQSNSLIAFPLCCYLYTSNKQIHRDNAFFSKPLTYFRQIVRNISEKNPIAYLVLLLVLFYDNKLPEKALNVFEQSSHDKDIIEKLKQSCRFKNTNIALKTILDAAHCLCKTYLIRDENEEQFSFFHNSIYDTVFVEFCKDNIAKGIEMCHISTLLEYVRTHKGSEAEVIVLVPRKMFSVLAKRLTKDLMTGNQKLIVAHPAFQDGEFRKFLYQFWNKETKTQIISYKAERQHVRTSQCLSIETVAYFLDKCLNQERNNSFTSYTFQAFEYDSIIASFVMSGADRMALHLLSFAQETLENQFVSEWLNSMLICAFYRNNRGLVDELIESGAEINLNCFTAVCVSPYVDSTIAELAVGILDDIDNIELLKHLLRVCLENVKLSVVHYIIRLISHKSGPSDIFLQLLILTHNTTPAWLQLQYETTFMHETLKMLNDLGAKYFTDKCLLVAAGCNDVSVLRSLLENGCNVNCRSINNQTPLHFAALYGSKENVQLLLHNKADVLATDSEGCSPLQFAVESLKDASEKVYILLKGSDIKCTTKYVETALSLAIKKGSPGCTEYLCSKVNNQDFNFGKQLLAALKVLLTYLSKYNKKENNIFQTERLRQSLEIVNIVKHFHDHSTHENLHYLQLDTSDFIHTAENIIREMTSGNILVSLLNHSVECGLLSIFKVILKNMTTTGGEYLRYLKHNLIQLLCMSNIETEDSDEQKHNIKVQMLEYFLSNESVDINAINEQGLTALHIAVSHGNVKIVKCLLDKGFDVNVKSNTGDTSLHFAVVSGQTDMERYLVENGAAISATCWNGDSPLHQAIGHGYTEIVKFFIKKGVDANITNINGQTILCTAVKNGHLDMVEYLVESGAIINVTDWYGNMPLHFAAEHGHTDIVKYLVKTGVDVNMTDNSGRTILHNTAQNGHYEIVRYLVENEATVDMTDWNGYTPLHFAAEHGHINIVKYLVKTGVDVNITGKHGLTLLHTAAIHGCFEIVRYLVERGVTIDVTDLYEDTPLHCAAQHGHIGITKYLVNKGTDLNVNDRKWKAILCTTVRNGHFEIVKYLVENGAVINVTDKNKDSLLHHATECGHIEIVKYLVDTGAYVDLTDRYGKTILHTAAKHGHFEIVLYLVEIGATMHMTFQNGNTPLHCAAENGHIEILKYLIGKRIVVTVSGRLWKNILYTAVKNGHFEVVQYLVEYGATIPNPDQYKDSLLHLAVEHGHIEIVKYIVENIADVNITGRFGIQFLCTAVKNGHFEIVNYLVNSGTTINVSGTSFYWAVRNGHTKIVKFLLKEGPDVNLASIYGKAILCTAVKNGHLDMVQYLVESGAFINKCNLYGDTPLQSAAEHGHFEIVKYLVQEGADVNFTDRSGRTILCTAVKTGHFKTVCFLLETGATINVADEYDGSSLHYATKHGYTEIAKYLVKKGADINMNDRFGESILSTAVKNGHFELVQYLVECGATIKVTDRYEDSLLHVAVEHGHTEIVKYLVENIADIILTGRLEQTLLCTAVKNGHFEIVHYLVERGTTINVTGWYEYTPLYLAVEHGHMDILKYFVEKGADVNVDTRPGKTCLCTAVKSGHFKMVRYLVESGGAISATCWSGNSPFYQAVEYGYTEIVKYLVEKGVNVSITGKYQHTILCTAVIKGHFEIVRCLVEKGATINANQTEDKPLYHAVRNGQTEIVKHLVEKGADVNASTIFQKPIIITAVELGHFEIVQNLVQGGAIINGTNQLSYYSPLCLATVYGHTKIVRYLVEKGADVNETDWSGQTVLKIAARSGHLEIVRYLVESGATINVTGCYEDSPLWSAREHEHFEIVKYLKKCATFSYQSISHQNADDF